MATVTLDDVKAIVTTTLADAVITVWINVAFSIVTNKSDCISGDDNYLSQIELQLAAHFVTVNDPSYKGAISKSKLDVMETTYAVSSMDKNAIEATPYGKAANMMAGGCLTEYDNKKASVGFF